jgi:hypothetical protein
LPVQQECGKNYGEENEGGPTHGNKLTARPCLPSVGAQILVTSTRVE